MKIILGIGNPGDAYAGTRHNCGFRVVDLLAERAGVRLRRGRVRARLATARVGSSPALLVAPETYVNLSGEVVPTLLREQGAGPADLLVICDDLNLPPGALRVLAQGSAGGHHGLESIIAHLGGTQDFPRVRIGIGSPGPGRDSADYVLETIPKAERARMEDAFTRSADAAACWVERGIAACMNAYNRKEAGEAPPPGA